MIRLLHLADLHLGAEPSYLGELAAERGKDFLDAFERAVDFALDPDKEIHAVLIAGDFFDGHNPSKETLSITLGRLKQLRRNSIPVILAPGNHDALGYSGSVYQDPNSEIRNLVHLIDSPNVERIETLTLNGESVHFYGMAWTFQHSHPPFDNFRAEKEEGYHIAILHGTLDRGNYTEVHERNVPLKLSQLAKTGMDYIALGHLHAYQEHRAGSIPVVYPGTLEGTRFKPGEEGERFLVVTTLTGRKSVELELLPWNQRTLQSDHLDLEEEVVESEGELAELIRERYADPDKLLRLHLVGTAPFVIDTTAVQDRLSGDFFWLDLRDRTNIFDSSLIETWEQEETIRGLYVRKLKARLKSASEDERQGIELALKLGVQAFEKTSRE